MSGLPCPEFMHETLEQLKIGSYDNIASVDAVVFRSFRDKILDGRVFETHAYRPGEA